MHQEKEKTQVTKIRNKELAKVVDPVGIKRISKTVILITLCQYIRQLDEMGRFLKRHKIPMLTQEEIT